MRYFLIFLFFLSFRMDAKAQGCFCDAAKHSSGNVHFGLVGRYGLAGFNDGNLNNTRTYFSPGLRIGTHITDALTIQSGVDYYSFTRLNTNNLSYPFHYHSIVEIPIHLIARIAPDNGRIMPYFGLGFSSRFTPKSNYYSSPDNPDNGYTVEEKMSVNADVLAGIWILISDQFSFSAGLEHRQTLLPLVSEGVKAEHLKSFTSAQIGFQIHF
ncbi:MAG: hypothetical protein ACK40M_11020 [Flavobacteriales bacterium]